MHHVQAEHAYGSLYRRGSRLETRWIVLPTRAKSELGVLLDTAYQPAPEQQQVIGSQCIITLPIDCLDADQAFMGLMRPQGHWPSPPPELALHAMNLSSVALADLWHALAPAIIVPDARGWRIRML